MKTQQNYLDSPAPYAGYRVYGHRVENTGRRSLSLVHAITKRQFTITTARYIMAVYLGYVLPADKHVDHIDGDSTNEDVKNLQLISGAANVSKGAHDGMHSRITVTGTCPYCHEQFTRISHPTTLRGNLLTFCSRSHATKFYASLKNNPDADRIKQDAVSTNNVQTSCLIRRSDYSTEDAIKIESISNELQLVLDFLSREHVPFVRQKRLCVCGSPLLPGRTYCSAACLEKNKKPRATLSPDKETLASLLASLNYSQIGRAYNVSSNAVSKWADKYGLRS